MATYTDILGLQNGWSTGETAGTSWFAGVANTLEALLASREEIDLSGSADVTPTEAVAYANVLTLAGVLTGNVDLILPAWDGKRWLVFNDTSGAFTVTVKTAAGAGVLVPQGAGKALYGDGTDVLEEPGGSGGGLSAPVADADLAEEYLKADGSRPAAGDVDFGTHQGKNAADPTDPQDLTTMSWVEGYVADEIAGIGGGGSYLPLAGGTMAGPINMDGQPITALPDPTNPQDPATMAWAEANFAPLTTRKPKEFGLFQVIGDESNLLLAYPITETTYLGGTASSISQGFAVLTGMVADGTITLYRKTLAGGSTLLCTITVPTSGGAMTFDFSAGELTFAATDRIEAYWSTTAGVSGWVALALAGEVDA